MNSALPSCSAIADGFNGVAVHLANHDVMLWAVSRAPLAKLQPYKRRMGWTFPWASSFGGEFNADFSVSFTEEQQRAGGIEYNYRREPAMQSSSAPPLVGGGDVEQHDLVRPVARVQDGQFSGVARVAQLDEVDALDHPAVGHVQAGDDSFG